MLLCEEIVANVPILIIKQEIELPCILFRCDDLLQYVTSSPGRLDTAFQHMATSLPARTTND